MIVCLVVWSGTEPSDKYFFWPVIKPAKPAGSWTCSSQHFLTCFSDGKSTTWSVRLGQLLLSAKKRDTTAFYDTLKLVRAEQIVPLSAASFERGSYQRGYEFIVRLHMLCELEHSLKPLFHKFPGDSCNEDSLNWAARLEMTQNSYRAKEPILALRRALLSLNKRLFILTYKKKKVGCLKVSILFILSWGVFFFLYLHFLFSVHRNSLHSWNKPRP